MRQHHSQQHDGKPKNKYAQLLGNYDKLGKAILQELYCAKAAALGVYPYLPLLTSPLSTSPCPTAPLTSSLGCLFAEPSHAHSSAWVCAAAATTTPHAPNEVHTA